MTTRPMTLADLQRKPLIWSPPVSRCADCGINPHVDPCCMTGAYDDDTDPDVAREQDDAWDAAEWGGQL